MSSPTAWLPASPPDYAAPLLAVDAYRTNRDGSAGVNVAARLVIDADLPPLRGHFPGLPIYPGVFVLESLEQAMTLAVSPQGPPLRVCHVRSVRFLAPLLAGDELRLDITARPGAAGGWSVDAQFRQHDDTLAGKVRAELALLEAADA